MTVTLPDLIYTYDALEPYIHRDIMELHHKKHHQAYISNLNAALQKMEESLANNDMRALSEANYAARFNSGGHFNHSLFWMILAPKAQGGGNLQSGPLQKLIESKYGTLKNLIELFNAETVAIQGSGWGWLAFDRNTKGLIITTSANQDPLRPNNLFPLMNIDVWEHAYYLQYKNARAEYLKNIWEIINWQVVEQRLASVL